MKLLTAYDSNVVIFADKTVHDYEVIKCGTAGHTIRGTMSVGGAPVGLIAGGQTLQITKTVSFTLNH